MAMSADPDVRSLPGAEHLDAPTTIAHAAYLRRTNGLPATAPVPEPFYFSHLAGMHSDPLLSRLVVTLHEAGEARGTAEEQLRRSEALLVAMIEPLKAARAALAATAERHAQPSLPLAA